MKSILCVKKSKEEFGKSVIKFFMFLITLAVLLLFFSRIAFAAIDPVEAVNNMNDYIAMFFQALGVMAMLVGVFLLALGFFSHDPSQKITGGVALGAGALLAGITFVIDAVVGG